MPTLYASAVHPRNLPTLHLELLRAAAPERSAEIDALIAAANVHIIPASDRQGFQLETAFGGIIVGHRAPAASWLVTCAAWKCVSAYSPALLFSTTLSSVAIARMPGQAEHVAEVSACLHAARALLAMPDAEAFTWPVGLPVPTASPVTPADEMVRKIAHFAWAFMLLHEIKHTELDALGSRPADPLEEERICDAFAVGFLLDNVDAYAVKAGEEPALVRDLRAMSVMTGLFLIAVLGHESDTSHPPPQERFEVLFRRTDGQPAKHFVLFAAALVLGVLEARSRPYDLRGFTRDHAGLRALTSAL